MTSTITGATTVTVSPAAGVATSVVVSGYPSSVKAGTANNFTVTLTDANGSTVTGYTGTVTFSSTDTKAVLPANYTFTSADAGQRRTPVRLNRRRRGVAADAAAAPDAAVPRTVLRLRPRPADERGSATACRQASSGC